MPIKKTPVQSRGGCKTVFRHPKSSYCMSHWKAFWLIFTVWGHKQCTGKPLGWRQSTEPGDGTGMGPVALGWKSEDFGPLPFFLLPSHGFLSCCLLYLSFLPSELLMLASIYVPKTEPGLRVPSISGFLYCFPFSIPGGGGWGAKKQNKQTNTVPCTWWGHLAYKKSLWPQTWKVLHGQWVFWPLFSNVLSCFHSCLWKHSSEKIDEAKALGFLIGWTPG